jgi:hypothetical protein
MIRYTHHGVDQPKNQDWLHFVLDGFEQALEKILKEIGE